MNTPCDIKKIIILGRKAVSMFLPDKLIMVDLEMTGVNPFQDKILQIAMIKLERRENEYVNVGEKEWFLHCDEQPTRDFHKQYLSHIFQKCNESILTPAAVRTDIDVWLGPYKGATPVGDCIPTDIYFLYIHDIIDMSDFDGDTHIPGTFDHEFFDLNAPKILSREKMQEKFEVPGVTKSHDALQDCRDQLLELNAYLDILLA